MSQDCAVVSKEVPDVVNFSSREGDITHITTRYIRYLLKKVKVSFYIIKLYNMFYIPQHIRLAN